MALIAISIAILAPPRSSATYLLHAYTAYAYRLFCHHAGDGYRLLGCLRYHTFNISSLRQPFSVYHYHLSRLLLPWLRYCYFVTLAGIIHCFRSSLPHVVTHYTTAWRHYIFTAEEEDSLRYYYMLHLLCTYRHDGMFYSIFNICYVYYAATYHAHLSPFCCRRYAPLLLLMTSYINAACHT